MNITNRLTENGVKNLFSINNGNTISLVVQIINLEQSKDNPIKITISDGFFFADVYAFGEKISRAQEEMKKYTIITGKFFPQNKVYIMKDFRVLLRDCDQIGHPIKYVEGVQNSRGSSMIPPQYLKNIQKQQENVLGKGTIQREVHVDARDFNKIINVTPFGQFKIRGRVSLKENKRLFNRDNQSKEVFSLIMHDETAEIKVTFWNDMSKQYYDKIQVGEVYSIENPQIKNNNRKYNPTNLDYEINISHKSTITKCEDNGDIPKLFFYLTKLSSIEKLQPNKNIDVMVIVDTIHPVEIKSVRGESKKIQRITVRDETHQIDVSVWEDNLQKINFEEKDIVLIKKAVVREFQGKQLGFGRNSEFVKEIPNCQAYMDLVDHVEGKGNLTSLGSGPREMKYFDIQSIKEICKQKLSSEGKLYFQTILYLSSVPNKMHYDSCSNEQCKKKVVQELNKFICPRCNQEIATPEPNFLSNFVFKDHSGKIYVLLVGSAQCQTIFDKNINELIKMQQLDEEQYHDFKQSKVYQCFKMTILAKKDNYQGQDRTKFNCIQMQRLENNFRSLSNQFYDILTKNLNQQIYHYQQYFLRTLKSEINLIVSTSQTLPFRIIIIHSTFKTLSFILIPRQLTSQCSSVFVNTFSSRLSFIIIRQYYKIILTQLTLLNTIVVAAD